MSKNISLSASACTYIPSDKCNNVVNFFMDGRTKYNHERNFIEVSVEKSGEEFLFALSNEPVVNAVNDKNYTSIINEIQKCYRDFTNKGRELSSKISELKDCIEISNNVLYSMTLNNQSNISRNIDFASLVITDNKVAALNIGKSSVLHIRNRVVKHMTFDYVKTGKLLKMGIINQEQADNLVKQFGASDDDGKMQVCVSDIIEAQEGDTFLLFGSDISNKIEDDVLDKIAISGKDTASIANLLIEELAKNDPNTAVSVLAVSVTGIEGEDIMKKNNGKSQKGRSKRTAHSTQGDTLQTFIAAAALFAVILSLMYAAYRLFNDSGKIPLISEDFITDNQGGGNQSPNNGNQSEGQPQDNNSGADNNSGTEQNNDNQNSGGQQGNTSDNQNQTGGNQNQTGGTQNQSGGSQNQSGGTQNGGNNSGTGSGGSSGNYITYTVVAGDTLTKISKQFYGDSQKYDRIVKANNLQDENSLIIGQVLIIPQD